MYHIVKVTYIMTLHIVHPYLMSYHINFQLSSIKITEETQSKHYNLPLHAEGDVIMTLYHSQQVQ